MRTGLVLAVLAALVLGGCGAGNPYYNPAKPHHTKEGFQNNHPTGERGSFWKWRWERFWDDLPAEPEGGYQPQVARVDTGFLAENRRVGTVTWIGHATLLLQYNGVNVLTDPHLTARASPLDFAGPKRRVPPALDFDELPPIDAVVISHNHFDHLDAETVERLAGQPGGPPRYFVPLGLKPWFAELGITTVTELDWWQERRYRGLRFILVPAQHFSARTPWDRYETLWGGWVVAHPGFRFYFAGDTGYSPDFREIGERLGPFDLAAIPIGAYAPRWFMKAMHINPEEAVRVHQDLNARYSVAMHWGTFAMTDEPIDEPPRRLRAALAEQGLPPQRFFVMKFGETRLLSPLLEERVARREAGAR